jgi:exodeoxyribonuclease V beta subunit
MANPRPFDELAPLPFGVTLLEASAGTGKTFCLTTLWLRLTLEYALPPSAILAVTFTRNATRELTTRIRARLLALRDTLDAGLPQGPDADPVLQAASLANIDTATIRTRIDDALESLDLAPIVTIHGFCQRTLQQQQTETGILTPSSGILAEQLIADIGDDFWALVTTRVSPQLFGRLLGAGLNAERVRAITHEVIRWPDAPLVATTDEGIVTIAPPRIGILDPEGALVRAATTFDVIAALVAWARREMDLRTRQHGLLTYDSMLGRVADALSDPLVAPDLRRALRQRYRAALIDEFQDTDPTQWRIFQDLFATPEHRLFLLGDPKQAIYGFRQADIRTYLEAARQADHHYTLNRNRRADASLVRALNGLFGRPATTLAFAEQGIRFEPAIATRPESGITPNDAPLRILLPTSTESEQRMQPRDACEELLLSPLVADIAHFIAPPTGRMLVDPTTGATRPLGPEDCAVIVRTNKQGAAVRDALVAAGIPAFVATSASVFASSEALDLHRVLRAVLLPQHTPWVRAALTSAFFGLSLDGIAARETAGDRLLETTAEYLRDLQQLWLGRGFLPMFRQLLADATPTIRARPDGLQALATLDRLGELLADAALEAALSPQFLVTWLEARLREAERPNTEHQLPDPGVRCAVVVITAHSAKGLEFPCVWIPFGWLPPYAATRDDRITIRRDARTAGNVVLQLPSKLVSGAHAHGPPEHAIANTREATDEAFHDDLRLLYVATTRARHTCTLFFCNRFKDWVNSPLAGLLLADPPANGVWSVLQQRQALRPLGPLPTPAFAARIAERHPAPGCQVLCVESTGRPVAIAPPATGATVLAPQTIRAWTRTAPLDDLWRRTSFSAIVRDFSDDHAGLPATTGDGDQRPADDERNTNHTIAGTEPEPGSETPLLDLPGSALLGNAIHRTLEHIDFRSANPTDIEPRAAVELTRHGLDPIDAPRIATMLANTLATPLATPDGAAFRLADIAPEARLNELDFVFPVARPDSDAAVTVDAIVKALRTTPAPHLGRWLAQLSAQPWKPLRGLLSGSIDLVFRVPNDGRIAIADWKSNRLGTRAADYGPEGMLAAMDHHHYHLQYHLYVVALLRHMRARDPNFSLERDFAGVFYFFVRGMHPRHPAGTGVFFTRPDPATLRALDDALATHTASHEPLAAQTPGGADR